VYFEWDFQKTSLSQAAVDAATVLILFCANMAENILDEKVQPIYPIVRIH